MTSEGLVEMFEGDSTDMCVAHVDGVQSGGSVVCRPGSKDLHQRERKLISVNTMPLQIGQLGNKHITILGLHSTHYCFLRCNKIKDRKI
jgi:hypothetical protein